MARNLTLWGISVCHMSVILERSDIGANGLDRIPQSILIQSFTQKSCRPKAIRLGETRCVIWYHLKNGERKHDGVLLSVSKVASFSLQYY